MIKRKVIPEGQFFVTTCWEACARMMWFWKYGQSEGSLQRYLSRLESFTRVGRGSINPDKTLTDAGAFGFFLIMGLRCLYDPKNSNIQHALKWSPVVISIKVPNGTHAIVIDGYSDGIYKTIDPFGYVRYDWDENNNIITSVAGQRKNLNEKRVNKNYLAGKMWYW